MIEQNIYLAESGIAKTDGYEQMLRFGYAGNANVYRINVSATGEWRGLTIRAHWHLPDGQSPAATLVVDGKLDVPGSATAQSGDGCITFEGSDGERTVTSADMKFRVGENSGTDDGTIPEPNTPAWQEFLWQIGAGGGTGAQLEIGTVTSGETADASITGGKLNLVLPKGDKGEPGEQGLQGEKGLPGADGVDGKPGKDGAQGPAGEKGDTGPAGPQGPVGPQGEQGVQGEPGAKGEKGDPGATGPKGDSGAQGPKGDKGDTGATGPIGPAGVDGKTPVKGVDYWTDADKQEILSEIDVGIPDYVQAAADAVAEKVLGVTGEAVEVESSGGYTNKLPLATDSSGDVYNGSGYKVGYRLNSSGIEKQITESYYDTSLCVTGFIPCIAGDVIRVSGMTIDPSDIQSGAYNIAVYDSSFNKVAASNWATVSANSTVELGDNGYIISISLTDTFGVSDIKYIRLSAKNITADSIVTVNEEISVGTIAVDKSRVPFNIAFLTDLHWNDADKSRMTSAAQALAAINKTATLDAVVFGGDYINNWSAISDADAKEDIAKCRKAFADAVDVPTLWLRGNHDNNPYPDVRLTKAEIFGRISRAQNTQVGYVSNWKDPYGCYGYMDFDNAKIRLVTVNTSDNDKFGMASLSSGYSALLDAYHIGAEQLQWFADNALDFSEKSNPAEWGLIFISHVPIHSENSWYNSHVYTDENGVAWSCNVVNLANLIKSYVAKKPFSVTINGETVEKDFSGIASAAKVLCFVNGHKHALISTEYDGFVYISCPNACNNGEKESDDGTTHTKGDVGTADETALTILSVDGANDKVYAWVYGAGYDREISV